MVTGNQQYTNEMKNTIHECLTPTYLEKKHFPSALNIKSDLGSEHKSK